MTVDLHTHSTASDGTDSPAVLVHKAAKAGLETVALTDHDTLEGIEEAEAAAKEAGIDLVPGVELSLDFDQGGMHLLVLWLQPGSGPLQDRLAGLQEGRSQRNAKILERLEELGMPIDPEELARESGGGSVGRPHIAAVMMARGYVEDIRTAFDEYLGSGKPAYVSRERLQPVEAIELARSSGGVCVLAHPSTLNVLSAPAMAAVLEPLVEAGLHGLEALYPSYRQHERDGYAALARRFGLVPSGGSDYHGHYKPGLDLGNGYGDLIVPKSVLEELEAGRP